MPHDLLAPLDGWIVALDDVPDAVFAERMLGDGVAIDPTGDVLVAPCDATVVAVQPTGHAVTLRTTAGAELLIHIGLDTVALDGRGFTPCVAAGDAVARGAALIRFDLDLIVREARAAVTPIVVTNGDRFAIRAAATGAVDTGAPLLTLVPLDTAETAQAAGGGEARRDIVVPLPHGIHARPAARIADLAKRLDAAVTLHKHHRSAAARSPVALLALGIVHGDAITVAAAGPDADAAADAVADLILTGIHEEAAPAPPPPPLAPAAAPPGTLAGVTASRGLATGTVARLAAGDATLAGPAADVGTELQRFDAARAGLSSDLGARAAAADDPLRSILTAHVAVLEDTTLSAFAVTRITAGQSAAQAWRDAIRPQEEALRATGDARLAERADDLRDLERQLIARLLGSDETRRALPPGTILVADDLLPSQLIALDLDHVAGIAVERGGPTSHVAILAAARGLPMLVALGDGLHAAKDGARVLLDATAGLLHLAPDAETLADADADIARAARTRAAMLARAGEPCRTRDGMRIEVFANCGSAEDARLAVANGAEGCGLLRTELLFLDRAAAPDEAEQTATYQTVAEAMAGRPLIVRLLDIGGDKPAPYLPIGPEENPALGLRGIRVGLAHPEVLQTQLRAILAVRPRGQCRIMVPMIVGVDELRRVRAVLDQLGGADVALGVMVETPAAAVTANVIAREADFLSIGTNDLTQYTLAMDRGNASVAAGIDGLHPSVLRLIAQTAAGGGAHGRWTGVCGGLASDPLAVPILIGLGITELSAVPAIVPEIKALVARLDMAAARAHADAALACATASEVRALARAFAQELAA